MHGGFAAEEVVVEQEVASHTCIDSLQGVSPGQSLLSFPSVALIRTEDAHRMFSIVDIGANHSLLGVR